MTPRNIFELLLAAHLLALFFVGASMALTLAILWFLSLVGAA